MMALMRCDVFADLLRAQRNDGDIRRGAHGAQPLYGDLGISQRRGAEKQAKCQDDGNQLFHENHLLNGFLCLFSRHIAEKWVKG